MQVGRGIQLEGSTQCAQEHFTAVHAMKSKKKEGEMAKLMRTNEQLAVDKYALRINQNEPHG